MYMVCEDKIANVDHIHLYKYSKALSYVQKAQYKFKLAYKSTYASTQRGLVKEDRERGYSIRFNRSLESQLYQEECNICCLMITKRNARNIKNIQFEYDIILGFYFR